MKVIQTPTAPAAIGPYSQAVAAGGFLYVSGQLGLSPEEGGMLEGVEAQTRQALKNVSAILRAAGLSPAEVVKVTVFVADMGDFAKVNAIYEEWLKPPYPAREVVQAAGLPKGARVEISAVAVDAGE